MELLQNFQAKVSSTLNRDVRQFGKKFMFDGESETCWNSDQGLPQFVSFEFTEPVLVAELHVRFQGGFAGQDCVLLAGDELTQVAHFYPEDSNSLQTFSIANGRPCTFYKLIFHSSTDFYGRITIYNLELIGEKQK